VSASHGSSHELMTLETLLWAGKCRYCLAVED
jgi:hypothetical protein